MKREFKISALLLMAMLVSGSVFLTSCKKDPVLPTLTTSDVSDITISSARTGGNITSNGGAEVTERGVCWGTSSQPVVSESHTSDSKGDGIFTSNITGLIPGTVYYIRAYATNEVGTAYGNEVSFATIALVAPVLTTTDITGVTSNAAVSGGNIISDGGAEVTVRGICWGPNPNPTIDQNKTSNGSGTGIFTANITGLTPGSSYHVRAYATNSVGTSYGNDLSFTTLAITPTLTTSTVSSVTRTTAVSGGNITNNGGASVTARGVCWNTTPGPVVTGFHTSDGTGNGIFTSNITGLNPNTLYYVRAYSTNSAGTSYGNELSFTTNPVQVPVLTTTSVTGVTLSAAVSGGFITEDNGGQVTERGVCWNTSGNPTTLNSKTSDGSGSGSFTSNIAGLTQGTVYYVRAYATNSAGTSYGNQIFFNTSISDIEGNVYKTVLIGTQVWMAENLRTTTYRDGFLVPNVPGAAEWRVLTTDAYCWYDNNESLYKATFGALYNWYSVDKGTLCPTGWRIPSDEEFKTLEIFLGMSQAQADLYSVIERGTDQGTKIKSSTGWFNGGNGSNSSGFNGLPGGYRYGADGGFYDIGRLCYWWSSTEFDALKATYRRIDYNLTGILREGTSKRGGKFIRCIKN